MDKKNSDKSAVYSSLSNGWRNLSDSRPESRYLIGMALAFMNGNFGLGAAGCRMPIVRRCEWIVLFTGMGISRGEERGRLARFIVERGRHKFLMKNSLIAASIFWLGMTALFLLRHHKESGWVILAVCGAAGVLPSVLFGFLLSLGMWKRFEQIAQSK